MKIHKIHDMKKKSVNWHKNTHISIQKHADSTLKATQRTMDAVDIILQRLFTFAHTFRASRKWADDQLHVMWIHTAIRQWNAYYGFQSAHTLVQRRNILNHLFLEYSLVCDAQNL